MEIGIYTFGDRTVDPELGRAPSPEERLRRLLEEAELADQVGLDLYAVGEHHRPEYVISAPAVVLAAIAGRTRRIRLSSAVVVLSSEDPIRVFQQFATLDLLSGGRAELMVGRGSFIESFPLFGYALEDYEALFNEKLALLLKLREAPLLQWPGGRFTPPVDGRGVYPRPLQQPLPLWLAAGGTPASVARAAALGLPLSLAIIGGNPAAFQPLVAAYRRQAGPRARLAIAAHGFIAPSRKQALELAFPAFKLVMDQLGRERGWGPLSRADFEASTGFQGANFVGEPEAIVEKILYQHALFGHQRLIVQLTVGTLPHREVLRAIELLGTEVAPKVRAALAVA